MIDIKYTLHTYILPVSDVLLKIFVGVRLFHAGGCFIFKKKCSLKIIIFLHPLTIITSYIELLIFLKIVFRRYLSY